MFIKLLSPTADGGGAVADSGVTEPSVETPIDASDASPAQEPHQEEGETGISENPNEEVLPFGKHPRWQKMNQDLRQERTESQRLQQTLQQYDPLIKLQGWVDSDPGRQQAFKRFITALWSGQDPFAQSQGQGEAQKDPYADYEPDVADRFRKLDALEQWKADQERKDEEDAQNQVLEHQGRLEITFENQLKKDGFLAEGATSDDPTIEVISNATKALLSSTARNPDLPTEQELMSAYQKVTSGLSAIEKRALKKTVKAPSSIPPPSGSNQGSIPTGRVRETEAQRIQRMVSFLD